MADLVEDTQGHARTNAPAAIANKVPARGSLHRAAAFMAAGGTPQQMESARQLRERLQATSRQQQQWRRWQQQMLMTQGTWRMRRRALQMMCSRGRASSSSSQTTAETQRAWSAFCVAARRCS